MTIWLIEAKKKLPNCDWFIWSYAAHAKKTRMLDYVADARKASPSFHFRVAKYIRVEAKP